MSVGYRLERTTAAVRRPRLFTCLALLAAAGLTIALPLLDHHAVELSPWHSHIVIGALTEQERALALAHHHHGPAAGRPASPTRAGAKSPTPQVLAITERPGGLLSFYGATGLGLFIAAAPMAAAPAVSVWQPFAPAEPLSGSIHLASLKPPPRAR